MGDVPDVECPKQSRLLFNAYSKTEKGNGSLRPPPCNKLLHLKDARQLAYLDKELPTYEFRPTPKRMNIALIDDEECSYENLKTAFRNIPNAKILPFRKCALDENDKHMLRAIQPQLIVLDVAMGETERRALGGLQVLLDIAEMSELKKIPVVLWTNHYHNEERISQYLNATHPAKAVLHKDNPNLTGMDFLHAAGMEETVKLDSI